MQETQSVDVFVERAESDLEAGGCAAYYVELSSELSERLRRRCGGVEEGIRQALVEYASR